MSASMRFVWITGFALTAFGPPVAVSADCSNWTLDGYRLGMRGDEVLEVRSVTLHVDRQAQAIVPGKLHGVLVLDAADRLDKWEVIYDRAEGDGLRAEIQRRFGAPTSDVTGTLPGDEPDVVRQRRTIWWSASCDAAIIVYENTSARGSPGTTISATLARTAMLPTGLAQMKTLFH